MNGAFRAASQVGGIGVVFRDEASNYARGFVRKINHANNPYTVELMAIREGLYWAMQRNMQCIILENDALQVVQGVGSLKRGSSSSDLLLDDVQECLRGFGSSKMCHVSRSANGAVHRMAKLALDFSSSFHWFEEPPDLIQVSSWMIVCRIHNKNKIVIIQLKKKKNYYQENRNKIQKEKDRTH